MLAATLLWLKSSSQVVTKSPMLLVAPKIETNVTKNDSMVPYDPDHAWCEMSMMKCHENQACENWIHLSKSLPHRKLEHWSAKMNSNNWRLVCFLKPTIELLLPVRWNQVMPGSHFLYCTFTNIMNTKYISCNITTNTKMISQIHKNKICENNIYLHILETFSKLSPLSGYV